MLPTPMLSAGARHEAIPFLIRSFVWCLECACRLHCCCFEMRPHHILFPSYKILALYLGDTHQWLVTKLLLARN